MEFSTINLNDFDLIFSILGRYNVLDDPMSSNVLNPGFGNNRICMNCGRSFQSGSNFEFDGGSAYM
ncbi:unnamed protein product [Meloidogyne enterolobii]|uniref:Uncharacterized protein n=1 Tax=Meloidogyne enterolobii TaxID=390850 RepID=A0ACB0ZKR6_MELEN